MAKISFHDLAHAYVPAPSKPEHWALKPMTMTLEDGGAYALLGPSGCGKTTLLNLISGLLIPAKGRIEFDNVDVTRKTPEERNIAQVFQFPVIYDTMTVYDNLAFPLRNRGVDEATVAARVEEIAGMLDLSATLRNRASGLTADGKQKISLGRGLVRSDVNVIMFDEPLTVIDPHLKWELRSKLKELHLRIRRTMIYVTHDQTEALTFADKVVVMNDGQVVQVGTPVELFERPRHTFVGHFIGSPGMNLIACEVRGGKAFVGGQEVATENAGHYAGGAKLLEVGIRPEFVKFSSEGVPVDVTKVADAGRFNIVSARIGDQPLKLLVPQGELVPSEGAKVTFDPSRARIYADGWLLGVTAQGAA
ncbi:MAG TPA: ABC transporter ATP-binding protein [Hyphomicrobium sp.]|nr:ABC transporter ATP-binding protein [Hyphomicrobium sp.]